MAATQSRRSRRTETTPTRGMARTSARATIPPVDLPDSNRTIISSRARSKDTTSPARRWDTTTSSKDRTRRVKAHIRLRASTVPVPAREDSTSRALAMFRSRDRARRRASAEVCSPVWRVVAAWISSSNQSHPHIWISINDDSGPGRPFSSDNGCGPASRKYKDLGLARCFMKD